MPEIRDEAVSLPIGRDEAIETVSLALTVLRVQIGPGKRLPGACDDERRRVAKRIVEHLDLCGLGICRTRFRAKR